MKFNGASVGFDEYVNGISMGFDEYVNGIL